MTSVEPISGAGLGLRRSMAKQFSQATPEGIDFLEVAPENWIGLGGKFAKQLRAITERTALIAHGLSLSIGGPAPLDIDLVESIKTFMDLHQVRLYSEHLSYTNDGGQLYDLLPMPFTEEAVHYTAARVRQVQDILGQQISLENASYYLTPKDTLGEVEFIKAVIQEADCKMLLDVNNVYVNSVNHNYDPLAFIQALPADRISYLHIAGHYLEDDGIIVDTHGANVIDPVWEILDETYKIIGLKPTLLERDFNIPATDVLMKEVQTIRNAQAAYQQSAPSREASTKEQTMTTLPPDSELLSLQTNFTQHLRNPDLVPVPDGLDKRRMGIYSGLIFHNISALMQDFFPVVYSLMEQAQWDDLIREFFITYRAETPYFPKLADEFLNFLMNRPGTNHEPDFLVPLAHYEWIELCLFTSEEQLPSKPLSETALKTRAIKLSELALPVSYEYPVHQIQSDWEEKQLTTCLLVFRDKMDDVRFFEIQPLAFELLSAMQQDGELMIMPWLEQKAALFGQTENPDFMRAGFDLVQQFNQEHLFI